MEIRAKKSEFYVLILLGTLWFALTSASVFACKVNLPKTGQTSCWDTDGNKISCPNTGEDGEIQAGTNWPSPRFTDTGDGTVTDNLTGLMWLKDGNCFGDLGLV